MVSIFIFASCERDGNFTSENAKSKNKQDEYLIDFYESQTFNRMKLSDWFEVDCIITKERVHYVLNENNINVPIINLKIENIQGKFIGIIEALSYKKPNGVTDFNILLRNFEKFDFNTKTGSISLIDINENLLYLKTKILNEKIINVTPYVTFHNEYSRTRHPRHPMDTNGDGNVTFSECYSYANAACQTDPECYAMCYLAGDAAGWVISGMGPLCQAAIAAACVVTAWNN